MKQVVKQLAQLDVFEVFNLIKRYFIKTCHIIEFCMYSNVLQVNESFEVEIST